MTAATNPLHAVAISTAVDADGPRAGVLILGPSGVGKSALALAMIEACPYQRTALIADDAVMIEVNAGSLWARAPEAVRGLIEVRGFGPAPVRSAPATSLALAIDLSLASERLPAPQQFHPLAGGPPLPLYPFVWKGAESTATVRLRQMIRSILSGQMQQRTHDSRPFCAVEDG